MSGSQQLLLGGAPTVTPVDPYFYSVTSLLHGDGTNGGQNNTFLDSSTNNFTITRNGNTTQGSFSPFSQTGWGNYFNGTNNTILQAPNGTAFQFPGDFTIDFWFYPTSFANYSTFFDGLTPGSASGTRPTSFLLYGDITTGTIKFFTNSTTSTGTGGPQLNTWNFISLQRSGSTITVYVNGLSVLSLTNSTNFSNGYCNIGSAVASGDTGCPTGYLSNFRIVKGSALSPSIPTAPSTAVSGTSLLTCQANRFLDASSNAFAITVTGSPSVQPFSPFNPITPYSTSSIGGSGYFDGSGDYLTLASNTNLAMGSGDFTVEFWIYKAASGTQSILDYASSGGFGCFITDTQITAFITVSTTYPVNAVVPLNSWNHIAFVRSGTTLTTYLNGVSQGTNTTSTNFTSPSTLFIGRNAGVAIEHLNGYLSGLRLIKGSAVTPTLTAPPTAVTNTQLLCNFTNGAIFDNAAVADYETVGNAQISTSVKKYGTGSLAFDGTGDYLVTYAPSTQSFAFGTGDFTVEFWYYSNNSGVQQILYDSRPSGTNGVYITLYKTSGNVIELYVNNGVRLTGTTTLSSGVWYHIALCRTASQTKIFVNGTQSGPTYADTNSYLNGTNRPVIGSDSATVGNLPLNGYIDDLRISKGIARYPYNFTPPTAEFPNIGGTVTLTADPYFDYTTLLLPGNGTNGAQNNTFLDSSTNNFTITRNGNTTQGTFSPFSQTGWGNFFDGDNDYLQPPSNSAFAFGTGDFTLECWVYVTTANDDAIYESRSDGNTADGFTLTAFSSSVIRIYTSSAIITASGLTYLNQWTHVAVVRSSGTISLYINGLLCGTSGTATNCTATNPLIGIGRYSSGSSPVAASSLNGYISNFRIVKGTAVYTANFTPPTAPLTAITNTSLLTCQSNRFVDNSSNAFAITRNGDVSVQAFSPFNPTAAWSAATYGGSGYFDGSGDYITVANATALQLTSSTAFTLEFWFYANALSAQQHIYMGYNTASPFAGWGFAFGANANPNTTLAFWDGTTWRTVASSLTTAQWYHVAVTSEGTASTGRLYLNGVQQGSAFTVASTINNTAQAIAVGAQNDGSLPFNGYVSNVRMLKGTAAYTGSTYTVPTAPFTNVTNTSLLYNFTNAGIYDATSKNDLETVGNAQISTTQSKFGGSSIYLDGNGDRLIEPASPNLALGSGDFTIECWLRRSSASSAQAAILQMSAGADSYSLLFGYTSGASLVIYISSNGSSWDIASAQTLGTVQNDTWVHYALTRYGSTFRAFQDGVQQSTWTSSASIYQATNQCSIGYAQGTHQLAGYINDLRITKGIARYTSNFTPPTTAFLTL